MDFKWFLFSVCLKFHDNNLLCYVILPIFLVVRSSTKQNRMDEEREEKNYDSNEIYLYLMISFLNRVNANIP